MGDPSEGTQQSLNGQQLFPQSLCHFQAQISPSGPKDVVSPFVIPSGIEQDSLGATWVRACTCLKVKMKLLSHVRLLVTPWTVAYQASPSMRFSRQEYWSGLPLPSPGDLPDPGIEPESTAFQAGTLPSEPPGNQNSIGLA